MNEQTDQSDKHKPVNIKISIQSQMTFFGFKYFLFIHILFINAILFLFKCKNGLAFWCFEKIKSDLLMASV
jgi:hypothetical protein